MFLSSPHPVVVIKACWISEFLAWDHLLLSQSHTTPTHPLLITSIGVTAEYRKKGIFPYDSLPRRQTREMCWGREGVIMLETEGSFPTSGRQQVSRDSSHSDLLWLCVCVRSCPTWLWRSLIYKSAVLKGEQAVSVSALPATKNHFCQIYSW